jgi:uroporphyrinogen decarboxylase
MLRGRELFLKALRREPVPRPPVWFLRQSGRYLPEFRALRKRHRFEDLLREPELVAEATALPLRRYPLDCAILFSDITAPFLESPFGLVFREGVGPVFTSRPRPEQLVRKLEGFETPRRLAESVKAAKREFPTRGFIGFAGGPYTLAIYLLGSPVALGRQRLHGLMRRQPRVAEELLGGLARIAAESLLLQARAGADALMIFDTWAGETRGGAPRSLAVEYARETIRICQYRKNCPSTIYYSRGSNRMIRELPKIGAASYSIDDSMTVRSAAKVLGGDHGIQGNLDPSVFGADAVTVVKAVKRQLSIAQGIRGYTFCTARGIGPAADPRLVGEAVRVVVTHAPNEVEQRGRTSS